MAVKRRMGPESAATRTVLMDAVEAVMREQGYAALSARSVAARAGLKYQIVFYYFETMDALLLTTYLRRLQAVLRESEEAAKSDRPLHALWHAASNPFDAALTLEYMAMANHNPAIRAATIEYGEKIRRSVVDALSAKLPKGHQDRAITPFGIYMAVNMVGSLLGFEAALGISGGHRETVALAEWCLRRLEPETGLSAKAPKTRVGARSKAPLRH